MRIGLLSDTHGFVDEAILDAFTNCDEIWHAGDIGSAEVLARLSAAKKLRAVSGNIDGPDVRGLVPDQLSWTIEETDVWMTHIGGHPDRYEPGIENELRARRPDVFICGHSHIPRAVWDAKLRLVHLNPGACGHAGWHTRRTVMRFEVAAGEVSGIDLVDLGPRGRRSTNPRL